MSAALIDRWRLRRACARRKLTFNELAEKTNLPPSRIYALSAGYLPPRREELVALAEVLGVDPETLPRRPHRAKPDAEGGRCPDRDRLLRLYGITSKNVCPRPEELRTIAEFLGLQPADLEGPKG